MTSRKKITSFTRDVALCRPWPIFHIFAAIVSDCIIHGKGRKILEDVMIFVRYDLPPLVCIYSADK